MRKALHPLIAALLVGACAPTPGQTGSRSTPAPASPGATPTAPAASPAPTASPTAAPLASPGAPLADATPGVLPANTIVGHVLDASGNAAGITQIRVFVIGNNGGNLISSGGGGLISPGGGGLISSGGGGIISDGGGSLIGKVRPGAGGFALLAEDAPQGQTDDQGFFTLEVPQAVLDGEAHLNIEAVKDESLKAFRMNAPVGNELLDLKLAPTGAASGKVKAPDSPTTTNLEGIDVFVPGTGYLAKTDASGAFTIQNMPAGEFTFVAKHPTLGEARLNRIEVASRATVDVPDLNLKLAVPKIASVTPANAGPGSELELHGENFGATTNAPLNITFGGLGISGIKRKDDATISFTVPANASSGDVVVRVGSAESNSVRVPVIAKLSIQPREIRLPLGQERVLNVEARDNLDQLIPAPVVKWESQGSAVVIDGKDVARGAAPGEATVKVSSGSVSDSLTFWVAVKYEEPVVSTVAGTGDEGYKDGPALEALFKHPQGIVLSPKGELFISDTLNHCIRKWTAGTVTTVAGNPNEVGYADGPGSVARFAEPVGLAFDPQGNLIVVDMVNNDMRKLAFRPDGTVTVSTVLGEPGRGYQDGPAATARLDRPVAVAIAPDGTIFFSDSANQRIRKLTPQGQVVTVAGNGTHAFSDGPGLDARFALPSGLALDPEGNLFVGDLENDKVRKLTFDAQGLATVTTVIGAKGGGYQDGPAADARVDDPTTLATDAAGNLYIGDWLGSKIRKLTPQGDVTTVVGKAGEGFTEGRTSTAQLDHPIGLAVDKGGKIYFCDTQNQRIRVITP